MKFHERLSHYANENAEFLAAITHYSRQSYDNTILACQQIIKNQKIVPLIVHELMALSAVSKEEKNYQVCVESLYSMGLYYLIQNEDFDKAALSFLFANALDPLHGEVKNALDNIEKKIEKQLRYSVVTSGSFGHMILECGMWLRKQHIKPEQNIYSILLFSEETINETIYKMLSRETNTVRDKTLESLFRILNVDIENFHYFVLPHHEMEPIMKRWVRYDDLFDDDLYLKAPPPASFTEEEENHGHKQMLKMGVDIDSQWYACVYARDPAYLATTKQETDTEKNSCRNFDINTLIPSIKYIIDQGGTVIRIGHSTQQQLNFSHPNLIDYVGAWRDKLDGDFMDIYLSLKCKYFIGGASSGATDLPITFGVPTLVVNNVPGLPGRGQHTLAIPKLLRNTENGELYPYHILASELTDPINDDARLYFNPHGQQYAEHGLEHVDNTEEEILLATKEMHLRAFGKFNPSEEEEALLKAYYDMHPKQHYLNRSRSPLAISFLKKYKNLFIQSEN